MTRASMMRPTFTEATLKRCTSLKHIVFLGTGAGSFIDLAAAERLGIKVSTIKGYGDTAVAEHAMGLVFAAARHIATMHTIMREGGWRVMQGMELKGKTLGLVGLGGIGREMARLAKGIGLNTIAFNRSPVADARVPMVSIDDLLARSDIVSLHLALNDGTRRFLDRTRLSKLKPGAILVNTARAGVVDDASLARSAALRPHRPLRHRRLCTRATEAGRPVAHARQRHAHCARRLQHARGSHDDVPSRNRPCYCGVASGKTWRILAGAQTGVVRRKGAD